MIDFMESPSKKGNPSPKFLAARERLPAGLRTIYDQIVDDYHYRTCVRFGGGYVAYQVMADLVLLGCRPAAPPIDPEDGTAARS